MPTGTTTDVYVSVGVACLWLAAHVDLLDYLPFGKLRMEAGARVAKDIQRFVAAVKYGIPTDQSGVEVDSDPMSLAIVKTTKDKRGRRKKKRKVFRFAPVLTPEFVWEMLFFVVGWVLLLMGINRVLLEHPWLGQDRQLRMLTLFAAASVPLVGVSGVMVPRVLYGYIRAARFAPFVLAYIASFTALGFVMSIAKDRDWVTMAHIAAAMVPVGELLIVGTRYKSENLPRFGRVIGSLLFSGGWAMLAVVGTKGIEYDAPSPILASSS